MIVISWLLIDICDYVIFKDSTGSRAYLSAIKGVDQAFCKVYTLCRIWKFIIFAIRNPN